MGKHKKDSASGKEDLIQMEGTVVQLLPDTSFLVDLDNENDSGVKHRIFAYASGKIRKNKIRILNGDRVEIEISPYDLTKGRITRRLKSA